MSPKRWMQERTLMREAPRLCFITPGHIASNPRLVKEANAAHAAGYSVRIVFSQYMHELAPADDAILARNPGWEFEVVRWRDNIDGQALRRRSAWRQRLSTMGFRASGIAASGVRALNRIYDEQLEAATRTPADLFIAHNLAALPVAVHAARRFDAHVTFDAEDFHRGELGADRASRANRRLIEWCETRFVPEVDAVSAASDGIAEAYAAALGIERPTTILNVFEQWERDVELPRALLDAERRDDGRSIYWFSQTIGPGRGLEDAVDALALLPRDVHLYVRGLWATGYKDSLFSRAARLGVDQRVHSLPPALPHQLVRLASLHDVGLALEQPVTANRSICVTNKLFTYLLAGIPAVASDTEGQRRVARGLTSIRMYEPGNSATLARAVTDMLADQGLRDAALTAARERYSWDLEQRHFLAIVERLVGSARPAVLHA